MTGISKIELAKIGGITPDTFNFNDTKNQITGEVTDKDSKKIYVRYKDDYGRQSKPYEGKKFTKSIDSKFIKFKKPKFGKNQNYNFGNIIISLEVHKNFKRLTKNKMSTIFAILDGGIVDKFGRNVLSYGDIIRTGTLNKLSEVFKIKKYLTVLKVLKR